MDFELLAQEPRGGLDIEVPVRKRLPVRVFPVRRGVRFRVQDFCRLEALQFRVQVFDGWKLHYVETARAQVQAGQPDRISRPQREQQGVATGVQKFVLDQGARRDDARDLALHRPPAGWAVTDLFADHCGFSEVDEFCEIGVERDDRDAGHWDGLTLGAATLGQHDIQQFGAALGVFEEQLVEVSHSVKQQVLGVLRLELKVLAHAGSMLLRRG